MVSVTTDITGAGQFTSSISPAKAHAAHRSSRDGYLNVSVVENSSWSATVVLQRSFDGGANWHDVKEYTGPTETSITDPEDGVLYRIGIPSDGTYSSGTIPVRLGK